MLYVNLGIENQSLRHLFAAVLCGERPQLQATFWEQPAQQQVLSAFDRADYVVVDGRARYQLAPQSLAEIAARSSEACAFGVASLRKVER
jgi:hypothetical protein